MIKTRLTSNLCWFRTFVADYNFFCGMFACQLAISSTPNTCRFHAPHTKIHSVFLVYSYRTIEPLHQGKKKKKNACRSITIKYVMIAVEAVLKRLSIKRNDRFEAKNSNNKKITLVSYTAIAYHPIIRLYIFPRPHQYF